MIDTFNPGSTTNGLGFDWTGLSVKR